MAFVSDFIAMTSEQQEAKLREIANKLAIASTQTESVICLKENLENSDLEYTAPTKQDLTDEANALLETALEALVGEFA